MDDSPTTLKFEKLHERHTGLTPALAESYVEAASVCFARHHKTPVTLSLNHKDENSSRILHFVMPDDRVRNAYANAIDTTETGAYAASLVVIEAVMGLVGVRRAETLTGADWYIAPEGVEIMDLENCIRLEVSGTSAPNTSEINRRLRDKIAQAARGESNLPAIASVVGFQVLQVAISP